MKKLGFPLVADVLFYTVCAFMLSIGILRYCRLPLALAAAVSSMIALAIGGIAFLILYRKSYRSLLGKRERERRDALLLHLALEKPERVRAALCEAYRSDGKEAHPKEDHLTVDGEAYIPLFTMEPVTADEIARLIRRFGEERFTVVCNALTAEAEKLLKTFGRGAVCAADVFALFSRTDAFPEPLICGQLPKKTVRFRLRRSFSKANARPFFVSGILLLLMSLFTFFPVYYLISGGILLICAVTVRLFGFPAQG